MGSEITRKGMAEYNGTAQHYKMCIVCNLTGQISIANYGQLLYRHPLVEPALYKAIRLVSSEFIRLQKRIIDIILLAFSNKFKALTTIAFDVFGILCNYWIII